MAIGKKDIIGVVEGDDRSAAYRGEIENERVIWHLVGGANTDHATLCGVDSEDSVCGTFGTIAPTAGQKVNCQQCINEFLHVKAMNISRSDFEI